jgi:hypothetical protein
MPEPKSARIFREAVRAQRTGTAYKPRTMPPSLVLAGKMPPMRKQTKREQQREVARGFARQMGKALGKPPPGKYTR